MLTAPMLRQIMPKLTPEKAEEYLPFLLAGMAEFRINNELRVAAYLAQLAHESNQLTRWIENLNYTAGRLTQVWPRRFPSLAAAQPYAHNPQALANRVYNGRMGNRAGSNDGWLYLGRMPMQATGRDMYELLSELLEVDLLSNPDLCLKPEIAFRASAAIFARVKNCNQLADGILTHPDNFTLITRRINGGTTGLNDRLEYFRRARRVLPDNLVVQGDRVLFVGQPGNFANQLPDDHFEEPADHFPDSNLLPPNNLNVSDPANLSPDVSSQAEGDQPALQNDLQTNKIELGTDNLKMSSETTGQAAPPESKPNSFSAVIPQIDAARTWLFRVSGLGAISTAAAWVGNAPLHIQIGLMALLGIILVGVIVIFKQYHREIFSYVTAMNTLKATPGVDNPELTTDHQPPTTENG